MSQEIDIDTYWGYCSVNLSPRSWSCSLLDVNAISDPKWEMIMRLSYSFVNKIDALYGSRRFYSRLVRFPSALTFDKTYCYLLIRIVVPDMDWSEAACFRVATHFQLQVHTLEENTGRDQLEQRFCIHIRECIDVSWTTSWLARAVSIIPWSMYIWDEKIRNCSIVCLPVILLPSSFKNLTKLQIMSWLQCLLLLSDHLRLRLSLPTPPRDMPWPAFHDTVLLHWVLGRVV